MNKLHFVGQAPPKPPGPEMPFGRTKLYAWLEQIGIDNFVMVDKRDNWNKIFKSQVNGKAILLAFDAIYNEFPGNNKHGHLKPTREQILSCKNYLYQSLTNFNADIIVPIGSLAISYCLDNQSYDEKVLKVNEFKLDKVIGEKFVAKPFGLTDNPKMIIPLPHPSGASTWHYKRDNINLLSKALNLIKDNI